MGQEESVVRAHRDVGSLAQPGKGLRSVVSDPLDDFLSFDRLWADLVLLLKTEFTKEPGIKEGHVVSFSDTEFQVLKTFDYGYGDFTDRLEYTLDKGNGEVLDKVHDFHSWLLKEVGVTKIHRSPLRIECWRQGLNPARRAGPLVADNLQQLLKYILGVDIKVEPNVASTVIPGVQSAVSEPLDALTDRDTLWNKILEAQRTQANNPFAKGVHLKALDALSKRFSAEVFDVEVLNDGHRLGAVGLGPPGGADSTIVYHFKAFEAIPALVIEVFTEDRLIADVSNILLTRSPLRAEAWAFSPWPRRSGPTLQSLMEHCLHRIIQKGAPGE